MIKAWNPWRFEPAVIGGAFIIALQWWAYSHGWSPEKTATTVGFATALVAMITRSSVVTPGTLHKAGLTMPEVVAMAADPDVATVEQKQGVGDGQRKV